MMEMVKRIFRWFNCRTIVKVGQIFFSVFQKSSHCETLRTISRWKPVAAFCCRHQLKEKKIFCSHKLNILSNPGFLGSDLYLAMSKTLLNTQPRERFQKQVLSKFWYFVKTRLATIYDKAHKLTYFGVKIHFGELLGGKSIFFKVTFLGPFLF